MSCNSSTYQFVTKSLRVTRHRLLTSKSSTLCGTHGLQAIRDFYPNKEVLLACGCRRDCFLRTPEEVSAFDAAHAEHQTRREIVGYCQPTAGGHVHHYEENVMEDECGKVISI